MNNLLNDLAPDDPRLPLLDEYLTRLQAGTPLPREPFLAEHPELAELLDCLDALEQLALPQDGDMETLLHTEPTARTPPSSGASGRRFGNYELLEELGRGGMGVVFKARQLGFNRLVAVKMILASNLATMEQVSRFQREARAAAAVQHPHIVRMFDVGEVEGQHYFAMEYVEGQTLAQRLRRGLPEPVAAARLLADLARAVGHLHDHGIIHRDLKPGNILMAADGMQLADSPSPADEDARDTLPSQSAIPKISDFGLARIREHAPQTNTGVVLGTPGYMAPEQAAGRGDRVGPASDIFSLGAILYEMLTGRPPFQAGSALNTILQTLENDPEPPRRHRAGVPPDLELICLKCLEKEPERRYSSAAELADDLERFLADEPVKARPDGPVQRVQRWLRHEPILAAHVLALVLGLALQLNYNLGATIDPAYHWPTQAILGIWLAGTVVCRRFLHDGRWADLGRVGWLAVDVVGLTYVLLFTENDMSAPLVGYALLVATSGLWFRVRIVWYTTLLCEAAYGLLILNTYLTRGVIENRHRAIVFAVLLALVGAVVAWQVRRVHFLSQRWLERER